MTSRQGEAARIIIRKKARVLELASGEVIERTFRIALGGSPQHGKEIEDDGRTPEGEYFIAVKNPESKYHLSLGLNYPSAADARRGFEAGLISADERDSIAEAERELRLPPQKTSLGGEIYIHGGGCTNDWTRGCIALDDQEMSVLYSLVAVGTRVSILP